MISKLLWYFLLLSSAICIAVFTRAIKYSIALWIARRDRDYIVNCGQAVKWND